MEKEGRPAVEVVLTVLHSGGKFGDGGGYKVSGGLHGVGVSVVNALSEQLHVEIRRDGYVWSQDYSRGAPQSRRCSRARSWPRASAPATRVTFLPDAEIFESLDFDFRTLEERLRETAFLTRGLKISIVDERGEGHSADFQYEGGIEDFVSYLNENKDTVHRKVIFFAGEGEEGAAEVAMQWNSSYQESIFSFANNINTREGGSPPVGLPLGADADAQQVRARQRPAEGERGQPRRRGRPRGPHRGDLGEAARPAVRGPDQDQARQPRDGRASSSRSSTPGSASSSRRTPREARAVIIKAVQAQRAREAARKARDLTRRKSALENSTLPGQARRLLGQGPRAGRAVRGRGRLRRRLGQAGPRPQHPGGAAAARQDPQRREDAASTRCCRTPRSRR